ncbi:MAG: homoserine O-acetyltransferase family protein [Pseudonocardiaceae bacterium]
MTALSTTVTGAWRDGDPAGRRLFAALPGLALERGGTLPRVRLAYETWGRLNAQRDNAVLVLHAMSGDSHATGDIEPGHPSPGWWQGVVGPGLGIDTDRWFVVCPNVLGGCQGSTGPSSTAPDGRPWGSRWRSITIRDQVATCRVQIEAIRTDPNWHGGDYYDEPDGPAAGMAIARRIAHLTYRCAEEVDTRFGRAATTGDDPLSEGFAVESWLDHSATSLQNRFDAGSYVALTEAMNTHEIGRCRGGTATALRRIRARPTIIGVDSDRLYPLHQQTELADLLGVDLQVIRSQRGHDGFLVETDQVNPVLAGALA